ncbi:MAG: hypothetical protein FD170_699 [Bacteroidetes bacterium]|nr:MAG: hypothetical protein FD170_699 [Bacteroidota bacterium]
MKYIIIILKTLFLLAIFQNLQAQDTFLHIFPHSEDISVYATIETNDHQLILCGDLSSSATPLDYEGMLLKINYNGELVHTIQTVTVDHYTNIKLSPNEEGVAYIVGYKDSAATNGIYNSIVLQKIDNNLEILYSWYIGLSNIGKSYPHDFVIVNDSLVFISSNYSLNSNPLLNSPSIYKLNLNTSQISNFEFPVNFIRFTSNIIDIEHLNQLKLSYFLFSSAPTSIATFDYNLNCLSDNPIESIYNSYNRIASFNDSSLLFSASSYTDDKRELGIANFNLNDSLIGQTIFPGNADSMTYPAVTKNILVTSDYIWVVGWYNVIPFSVPCFPESTWVVLNKLNHNLELQEQLFYGGDAVYNPYDVIETSDHHIVVTGNYYNPYLIPYECKFDPFVLKVNSEGLIVNTQNNELPLAQEAIVFPNPGSDYLQIKLAVQHKTATLQLFDLNGRLIHTEEITADMQRVNTTTLPAGIYPYRISANNRVIGSGKWVKE